MAVARITCLIYALLTIFLAVNATTLSFWMVLPAVFLMWINYFVFRTGCRGLQTKTMSQELPASAVLSKWAMTVLCVIAVLFSTAIVHYYTGQTPVSVVTNLAMKESLYKQYQLYFLESGLDAFTVSKVPYIFMMFCVKLLMIYSYMALFALKQTATGGEKIYLFVVSVAYLFISAARGTSIELFEFFFLIVYSITAGAMQNGRLKILASSRTLWVGLLGACCLLLFTYFINLRGDLGGYITHEIRYDPNAVLSRIAAPLALLTLEMCGYFGFGFFFTSVFIREIWLDSVESFFAGLIPYGLSTIGRGPLDMEICDIKIDCGAAWIPDAVLLMNASGLFGVLLFCFILGRFLRYVDARGKVSHRALSEMTKFMIMLQMISLPIGNFIIISSANILITCVLIIVWLCFLVKSGCIRLLRKANWKPDSCHNLSNNHTIPNVV